MQYESTAYFQLLTKGNPKTVKGEKRGYLTFILHLAPANLSGYEMCRWRTKGCSAACLNLAGRGGMFKTGENTNVIQEARKRKTKAFVEERAEFLAVLVADIERGIRYAAKRGLTPVFRLNGTSDVLWENIPVQRNGQQFEHMFAAFPDVQFYDYTKAPYNVRRHDIPNYALTFSYAETGRNRSEATVWLSMGHNMTVVFPTAKFPSTFLGREVINGDESDLRFLDKRGVVVGLKAKGYSKQLSKANGFVIG